MNERVQRAIESLVPGEVIKMPAWRLVQVQAMPDGTVCRMGPRIAVRNCHTGRLSYIHAVTLKLVKDRAASPQAETAKGDE